MRISRRSTLKKIGVLSAWSTPIIQSIVLPAHAQTSSATTPPPTTLAPTTPAPTTTVDPGMPLLHISAVIPNPVGGDCGPDAREIVSLSNAGTAPADLTGHSINRVVTSGAELLVSLSGVISAGQTIDYDVCQGSTAGTSARLNNMLGGVVSVTDGSGIIDIVRYPSVLNGPAEGTVVTYGATPSTGTPRSS